jgi:hypothetical protein
MRAIFSSLLIAATLLTSHVARAKDVYLALVEPSGGLSMLGHAALILAEDDASPITGAVYSYTVHGGSNYKFRAERHLGFSYFQQTSIVENRSMVLLKLNLSPEEKQKLAAKVQADVDSGDKFGHENSFNLFDINCVTYILTQINAVASADKQINIQAHSSFWTTIFGGPWNFLDNIRFRAPVPAIVYLESHPIAAEKLRWIPRFEIRQAQTVASRLIPALSQLSECKGWKPQTLDTLKLTAALALKQQSAPLLKAIRQLQEKSRACDHEDKLNSNFWMAAHDVLPLHATTLRDMVSAWAKEPK